MKDHQNGLENPAKTVWNMLTSEFLANYFLPGKTQDLKNKILGYTQNIECIGNE